MFEVPIESLFHFLVFFCSNQSILVSTSDNHLGRTKVHLSLFLNHVV